MQLGHKFHGGQIELVAVVGGQNRPEIAFVGGIEAGVGSCLGREKVRLGLTIACVVAIYVAMRFSQFPFMILDHNAGAVDALRFSWEATYRRVGTLNLVYTMLFLINLGGFLACCVGLIFTLPFTGLMLAVTYLSMTAQPLGGRKPAPGPWDEVSFDAD